MIQQQRLDSSIEAIHLGEHLADDLAELDMTATQFATALGVPTHRITAIIRGRRGITAHTALRLGRWLGTSAEYWMNLQQIYELRLAQQEHGEEIERTVQPRSVA